MRIDTGVESLDSFWVTLYNRRGMPITTGGDLSKDPSERLFRVELWSPTSPLMAALRNSQLDKNEVERLRLRQEVQMQGLKGEALEERVWQFLGEEVTETSFETISRAIKSWENFPRLMNPDTRDAFPDEQQPEGWPPECNRQNAQQFCIDNPDMLLQLKRAYDNEKNFLKEPAENSLRNSSNTPNDKQDLTSPNQMDTVSGNT